ncbi:glycerophosphodiester phosphodiesterase family protein [Bradyrhizobium sp. LHD-71]|uniref:glycerophosphodiester phosphodiesterase family protein n=1 Tax=Bradyrhizobium sp. LHD-71 TaxID=3072141 RepID=UPI00280E5162|nr:glycerophosphodiester phosphodiesterase family protein [Bradyrhizobium sp. LHD-71]MDQ8731417.1 glycerophosphodiester phosphodiesterase family protein [Bradyrhizobium sp. LHD-71]
MSDAILFAHRGTNPYLDNSIDAYRWGFNYGADYAETDFRLTKDGVLVSYHDDLPGGIANMTYAEVRAQVPTVVTLDELIALTKEMSAETGRKLGILIETKSADYATHEAVIKTLIAHDFADPERIIIQSFGSELPDVRNTLMPQYGVDLPLVQLTSAALTAETIAHYATYADGVAPVMSLLTPELVAAAHAAGLVVNGWTVEGTLADVQRALDLGVDGIIADNTQWSRPALEKLLNDVNVIYGNEQWDVVNGTVGADKLYAMQGDDILRAGDGDDMLYGDGGNDLLFGGTGADGLIGGGGNDFLSGGEGADVLDGGGGNDVVVATGDRVVFRAGDGIDLVSLDDTSTIVFDGVAPTSVSVIRDGNNLIIRSGNDALVLLNGVDPAHQPASIATADGLTLTGAELAALAMPGTDAEVAALLPTLQAVLANAPGFAAPSTIPVGTDLIVDGDFGDGVLAQQIEDAETGAVYRLSFSLADLPTGEDGVRVLWGGQVIYEGIPDSTASKLHFIVAGGSGDGSNALMFEGMGASFGAALDDVHLVKLSDPMLPAPGNVAPEAAEVDILVGQNLPFNGKVAATDANGDALIYSLGEAPAHGTVIFDANGSYRYTPAADFTGTDGFTFLANDGHGGFVETAVNLTVVPGIPVGMDLIVNGSFEDVSESSGSNGPSDWGYRNPDGAIVGWTNVNNMRIEQHWDHYGGVNAKDGQFWIDMDSSNLAARHRIGQTIAHVETGATYRVSFSLSDSDTVRNDDGVRVLWNGEVIFEGLPPQTGASWTTYTFDVIGGSGDGSNRLEFMDTGVADSWGAGVALDDVHFVKAADVPAPGTGTPGDDILTGTTGDDVILAGLGDDEVDGGAGNDTLDGGEGDDLLDGGAGGDVLKGGEGDDELIGGSGSDILIGGAGDDLIDGGEGIDTVDYSDDSVGIVVDLAAGEANGDDIGEDELIGVENVIGGSADDILIGDDAANHLDGGAGNDTLKGGAGDDTLWGGEGNDVLDGGSGDDAVYGGLGNDTIKAGSGDDQIDAGQGNDVLDAGSGDDVVLAGAGDDVIDGGSGDDRIEGGEGNDLLSGGSGRDVFVFAADFGKDTVGDFKTTGSSADVLEFAIDVFANFDAAIGAAHQEGADIVFAVDADTSLTLKNVQLASLQADDFHFV